MNAFDIYRKMQCFDEIYIGKHADWITDSVYQPFVLSGAGSQAANGAYVYTGNIQRLFSGSNGQQVLYTQQNGSCTIELLSSLTSFIQDGETYANYEVRLQLMSGGVVLYETVWQEIKGGSKPEFSANAERMVWACIGAPTFSTVQSGDAPLPQNVDNRPVAFDIIVNPFHEEKAELMLTTNAGIEIMLIMDDGQGIVNEITANRETTLSYTPVQFKSSVHGVIDCYRNANPPVLTKLKLNGTDVHLSCKLAMLFMIGQLTHVEMRGNGGYPGTDLGGAISLLDLLAFYGGPDNGYLDISGYPYIPTSLQNSITRLEAKGWTVIRD